MNMQYPPVRFTSNPTGWPEMDRDLAVALDRWRLAQNPPLSVPAAVYELMRRALLAEGNRTTPVRETDSQTAAFIRAFTETRSR